MCPVQGDLSSFVAGRLKEVLGPQRREELRILAKVVVAAIAWISMSLAIPAWELLPESENKPPQVEYVSAHLDEVAAAEMPLASAIAQLSMSER
jgi:hypothetical protein